MPQPQHTTLNRRLIEQSIAKGMKKVIVASGITSSTRQGNKELHSLIKRLAQQPLTSLAAATQLGEAVAHQLIEQAQQRGKTYLDQGTIRQLLLQPHLFTAFDRSINSNSSPVQSEPSSGGVQSVAEKMEDIEEDDSNEENQEDEENREELEESAGADSDAEQDRGTIEILLEEGNREVENFIEAGNEEIENFIEASEVKELEDKLENEEIRE